MLIRRIAFTDYNGRNLILAVPARCRRCYFGTTESVLYPHRNCCPIELFQLTKCFGRCLNEWTPAMRVARWAVLQQTAALDHLLGDFG